MRTRRLLECRQSAITRAEEEGRLGGWRTIRPTQILMSNCPPPSHPYHTLCRRGRVIFLLFERGGGDSLVICRSGGRVVWRIMLVI